MNVTSIKRTERQEYACKLRELARLVDGGKIAYITVYIVNKNGIAEELIMNGDGPSLVQSA